MTVSNSIFQQLCPACATSIPINAQRCECGHDLSGTGSQLESSLRDEELYENYLAARAEQAREAEQIAARALLEDRDNADLAETLSLAREVANSIDADLANQRSKVQKLRALIPPPVVALPPVEPPRIEKAPAPPIQVTAVSQSEMKIASPAVEPATAQPEPVAITPPAESPVVILTTTPITSKTPEEPVATPAVLATPHAAIQKASNALSALKQAKAREGAQQLAALRAQIARQKKADKEKAEREAREAAERLKTQTPVAPPASFREEQAARAERVLQEHVVLSGKECPNCTSRVPSNTTRCQCGFAFAGGDTDLPSLTLCTGDFTALRNSFMSELRGRR